MNLLGKATDAEFWSQTLTTKDCYKQFVEERLRDWNDYCEDKDIPNLNYTDFKTFFVSGERNTYQLPYFFRRGQLATSALMALIYPEERKYIDFLNNIIFSICNEYTWALPAHQPSLDVYDKTVIDLFAAETGFALAEIYTILGNRLDPLVKESIRIAIDERIINSYISGRHFWWDHGCTNNWAAVCGGSIASTFMLMRPELFESIKPRIDEDMESFLSGFLDDGYCLEGTSYWNYGFGYFVTYADMLKTYTNGDEDYFRIEKVKRIATFMQKMFLSENSAVSFSDGDATTSYHIGLLHYLKNIYPDDVKVYSPKLSFNRDKCYRFALLLRAATWIDEYAYKHHEEDNADAEYYAENSQWYVKRTENYGFAAKGGYNNEHHNHNDVGTFIFAKNGKQLITDMGRGVYSKQYFAKDTRYNLIECSSLGHNVPHFDGMAQKFGTEFSATNVKHSDGCLSMDIAGAYGDEAIKGIHRTFICRNDSVTLKDEFDVSEGISITERLVSLYSPTLLDGSIKIENCEVIFDKNICDVNVSETIKTNGRTVYLIDFKIKDNQFELKII